MAGGYAKQKASKKLSSEENLAVVKRVRENIEDCWSFERDNRREAEIDLQFFAGDQWSAVAKAARGTTRPMLTINQLPQFVQQVTNPTREADIAIKVVGVDDQSDPQLAKIYAGTIRQIEYRSNAKAVYVNGNEHQVKCGIGWWRVCSEYVDDAVFDQELKIKRIQNPLSVYCDPGAVEPDKSDAMWIAVIENWPRKKFKATYPQASAEGLDVPGGETASSFMWGTPETVAVAEYYEKVPVKKTMAQCQSGAIVDITGKGEGELGQMDQTDAITGVREVDTFKVVKYCVSGKEVLEGPIDWPGKYIPLVCVTGAETPLKNGTMRFGIVRFARDPQQMMNFYRTATAEAIALAPKTPWLVTDTMIEDHKGEWDVMNQRVTPYLRYKPDQRFPGLMPKRESGPEVPMALMEGANIAAEDLKRVTGIFDASLGARSNETSGIAIGAREQQGQTANNHFADNLMAALVHTGRILIDLIPHIYDNERVMRLTDDNGVEESVTINKVLYQIDGQDVVENDLSQARFDVRVTVGKNYLTKRVEALGAMLEFAKALPPQAQMLFLDLIAKNSDWPGADELAKRFRSLVPPEALADPNDPNAAKPPGPMDDPAMIAQLEELEAKINDLKASAEKKLAEAEQTKVETAQLTGALPPPAPEMGPNTSVPVTASAPPAPPSGFEGGSLAA